MAPPMARFTAEDSSIGKFRYLKISVEHVLLKHNDVGKNFIRTVRETWMKRCFVDETITGSFIERTLIAFSQLAVSH